MESDISETPLCPGHPCHPHPGAEISNTPSSRLGTLEFCTGRSIGQTKPQNSVLAYSRDPSIREATGALRTILHGSRVILGILGRSASPMLQQHPSPHGCACTEQPLSSGGNSHSPNRSSSPFAQNPAVTNPMGKQFCSYLSQGEGDLPRGSQWEPGLALPQCPREPPEQCLCPMCIPPTGCAQGAPPARSQCHKDTVEQLLGALAFSFPGFIGLSCSM